MKAIPLSLLLLLNLSVLAQTRVFPVIKNYGGIFEVPDAVEKPAEDLPYKIVIELVTGADEPKQLNNSLNNIARLINLHAIGGVPKENLSVVVAIHGEAAYSILDNEQYQEKYKTENPNLALYTALREAGVQLFICGQSLIARNIDRKKIAPEIVIATSMLTVVTTHQLKGYAYLKF
jgi:intracellular sulfur oxidation DsrE/DsrF family protein